MARLKFGLAFANIEPFVAPERAAVLAVAAEEAGFESIWTVDHVVVPAGYNSRYPYDPSGRIPSGDDTVFPDPLIWLAYIARATSTIRLGTGILIIPQRNPLVLAKQLATLDYLSGGRMILGTGIGWMKDEFEALGIPFAERAQRNDETIAAMRALWSEDRATFEGATVQFRDCYLRPQPPGGSIPVHVGGHSEAAARRAGTIGDGFFPFGVTLEQLPPLIEEMSRSAREAGRDPSSIEVTVSSMGVIGDNAKAEIEAIEAIEALGVTRVVIPAGVFGADPAESLTRYAEDVIKLS